MKRLCNMIASAVLILFLMPVSAHAARFLIPGGQIVGLQLRSGSVTVAAFDDVLGANARESGLKIGDDILSVDGTAVTCVEDIRRALNQAGETVTLSVRRAGREKVLELEPCKTEEGPRLGIHLKQGINGIGTVTWYDPGKGTFGTLGHGVSGPKGELLQMTGGNAYDARVVAVKKGASGEPGLLKGSADAMGICGDLIRNTPQGVFGISKTGWRGEPLPTAEFEEIRTGSAVIRSTVDSGGVQEYSVEILKIYPRDRQDGRNFLIHVTDPDLLSKTGGIVQGMSGSPILQDGKLVGAVTHVLVNDPTRGYGIFIENMLDAAG